MRLPVYSRRFGWPALLAWPLVLVGGVASAGEDGLFPARVEANVGGKERKLRRTGVAVRSRGPINVYALAAYLEEGAAARNAEELLRCPDCKQLHLHFLAAVSGPEMAKAFVAVFRANHPEPAFEKEVKQLTALFEKNPVRRGHKVVIAHVPMVGLRCRLPSGDEVTIGNVDFSQAVWCNYLGKAPVTEEVKRGLVSELK